MRERVGAVAACVAFLSIYAGGETIATVPLLSVAPAGFDYSFPAVPSDSVKSAPRCSGSAFSVIRVLVLYDKLAESAIGRETLLQSVPRVIGQADEVLARSLVAARLEIASIKPFSITEQSTLAEDLDLLTPPKGLHAARLLHEKKAVAADIAMLLVSGGTGDDGKSNQLMEPFDRFGPFATGVVTVGALFSSYVFVHEIGHIMGAGHENGPGAFSFSRAKVWTASAQGTVMARGVPTRNIIPLFSNPAVTVPGNTIGERTGDSAHDNARTLNLTRGCVEKFRP